MGDLLKKLLIVWVYVREVSRRVWKVMGWFMVLCGNGLVLYV